jgi:hypothetical protein
MTWKNKNKVSAGGGRDAPTWRAFENPESKVHDEKCPVQAYAE